MFFDGFASIGKVVILGLAIYAALLLFLRISGKRTIATMSPMDFVVAVAVGNIVAMAMLSREVSLVAAVVAIALLTLASRVLDRLALRVDRVRVVLEGKPRVLFRDGRFDVGALEKERVSEDDVLAAIRHRGHDTFDDVRAVVLETSGEFSVIERRSDGHCTTLRGVEGTSSQAPEDPVAKH